VLYYFTFSYNIAGIKFVFVDYIIFMYGIVAIPYYMFMLDYTL